ncbi:MAG TPA: N-acetylmuramoyl-L-alanine amidase [Terriglobia bacterium]|nr:N-acetylmuramoyl-L-alanine amidase [Terriglobia bacterium]
MRRACETLIWGLMCAVTLVAAPAQSSLLDQSRAAFQSAQKMESALNDRAASSRKRADYLRIIEAYQRVYLITPHTPYADDALLAVARLYEAIQDPSDAVKTLRFMVHDYPQTPFKTQAEKDIERLLSGRDAPEAPAEKAAEKTGDPVPVALTTERASEKPSEKTVVMVENVRYFEAPNSYRVVIDVSGEFRYLQELLQSPDRFYVDLSQTRLNRDLLTRQWQVHSNLLQQIRVGQFDNTTVRVVLDLGKVEKVTSFTLRDPDRLIIDVLGRGAVALSRTSENPNAPAPPPSIDVTPLTGVPVPARPAQVIAAAVPPPVPAAAPAAAAVASAPAVTAAVPPAVTPGPSAPVAAQTTPTPIAATARVTGGPVPTPAKPNDRGGTSLVRSLGLKIAKVVIDPGHGGNDTGTIGPTGYTEKDLALDISRRLKALVETELGAEVVLTRDDDVFIPLEARTAIANQSQADLFISIHANSSNVASARGVETFYLNYTPSSREALELASRENASSQASIHDLQDIIKKMMMNDKAKESRELAGHIQKAMAERKGSGPDRGVKEASFVVLIGANMPSILAEVGFISNPQEERSVKTPAYRQQIAESLFKGIRSYAETLSGVKTANSFDKE